MKGGCSDLKAGAEARAKDLAKRFGAEGHKGGRLRRQLHLNHVDLRQIQTYKSGDGLLVMNLWHT